MLLFQRFPSENKLYNSHTFSYFYLFKVNFNKNENIYIEICNLKKGLKILYGCDLNNMCTYTIKHTFTKQLHFKNVLFTRQFKKF